MALSNEIGSFLGRGRTGGDRKTIARGSDKATWPNHIPSPGGWALNDDQSENGPSRYRPESCVVQDQADVPRCAQAPARAWIAEPLAPAGLPLSPLAFAEQPHVPLYAAAAHEFHVEHCYFAVLTNRQPAHPTERQLMDFARHNVSEIDADFRRRLVSKMRLFSPSRDGFYMDREGRSRYNALS
jgi:hypothetical protein